MATSTDDSVISAFLDRRRASRVFPRFRGHDRENVGIPSRRRFLSADGSTARNTFIGSRTLAPDHVPVEIGAPK